MIAKSTTHRLLFLTAIGLSVAVLLFTSCQTKKEYTVRISSVHPDTKKQTEKVVAIKERDDTSAYKEACESFWLDKVVALEMNKKFEGQDESLVSPIPISFTVHSADGKAITYSEEESNRLTAETVSYFDKRLKQIDTITPLARQGIPRRAIDSLDQKKAFKDLLFGLTLKDFKKNKGYNSYDSIGDYQYKVLPVFDHENKLYKINIESTYSRTANYYDTEVKSQHQNLVKVISEKYGPPSQSKMYPSFIDMDPGYISFNNTWYLGDKIIKIGVGENENTYYASCWIYSEKMQKDYDQFQEKNKSDKLSADKDKF